ncbi:thioredoxin reductase/SAM-dependent methyltransferase [Microbacterium endophyticum]|uniref:Thioredoxin reductase/SAM-dependent methyltransferase n=1 Tax=Microbacterium endophyticum TaxID=1526412 RepID=A0A7W4V291_9MICO|nr:FAD-dependent oxidoreductase [Microbacterium endophyticum]MBB2975214.1 thioredoxin reductase/SAM-dependent methyltransferase [Microbacterium endophyticum]NIK37574.1 thioredoxin reductase/SAM-dependent methyltransferase [Microbacterium endophyticum]
MENTSWDTIIIGGGAAGLSAALMLGRARRRTLVIDSGAPRNRFADHMHGVLGHDGISPADLIARGRAEVARYGVEVVSGEVSRVDAGEASVTVVYGPGASATARSVIIATGLADELPDVAGLAERWGKGVLHCPYCHGWEVRDGRLGVLLTSPMALHQAELVRQWSSTEIVFTGLIGGIDDDAAHRLRARGVEIVTEPVVEVFGEGRAVAGVRLESGTTVPLDALFVASMPRPIDGFVSHLGLSRTDSPVGSFLATDAVGTTSHPRIFAAGNVVDPRATVPMAMGAAAGVGAAVNAMLVQEDTEAATFWEERYAGSERVWSGHPNSTMVDVVSDLNPGTALDLGCGEGGDTVWLAQNGWDATGLDISPTAIARATAAASSLGIDRARFVLADLSTWRSDQVFDLVTTSFLHSPVALDRIAALRQAAERVAVGGHLLIVSHAAPPPGSGGAHHHADMFVAPADEVRMLALDPTHWEAVLTESRRRKTTTDVWHEDGVILLQRLS